MATELQAFEQARKGVLQATAPFLGMMSDRVAVKREDIERDRKLIDDKRLRDEARADWIERFNMQSNAAKDAAKAGRDFSTSEREAVERYRSGEADYVYWRNRQDQLADRGWAVEQDEKEMRLKAAQWGMANATDPATSIEDVYKHMYERAPEELAMLKKRQSEAFRRLNPEMHDTYDAIRNQRISVKNQIANLISNNQGATDLELANAIIPELLHWELSDDDTQNIRDNGLSAIAAVIKGDEARQAEIKLILERVNTATLSRKADNLRVSLGLLVGQDDELLRTMKRIEEENPKIGLEDPEAYTNEAANRQLGDGLTGGENNRFDGLPVSGAGGEGAGVGAGTTANVGEGSSAPTSAPPTPMQGTEPITSPEASWTRGGADTSGPDSELGEPQLSPEALRMRGSDLGDHYNFPELTEDASELEAERDNLVGRISRQREITDRMRRRWTEHSSPQNLATIEEGMRRHQVRLDDINKRLFKLNQPPAPQAEPMSGKDYVNEQSVLRGMGYPNPNRELGASEKAQRTIYGDSWIDPRTVGPEERRLLRTMPTFQNWDGRAR